MHVAADATQKSGKLFTLPVCTTKQPASQQATFMISFDAVTTTYSGYMTQSNYYVGGGGVRCGWRGVDSFILLGTISFIGGA